MEKSMKINVIKTPEGWEPASAVDKVEHQKFKAGAMYPMEIKRSRNPVFHGKMFVFLAHCFDHWTESNFPTHYEFMNEIEQRETFRKEMLIFAGFYYFTIPLNASNKPVDLSEYYNAEFGFYNTPPPPQLNLVVNAQSMSFGSMGQSKFECVYTRLINVAMMYLFNNCESKQNELLRMFD